MEARRIDKVTVCGGGNGAQTLVPIAAGNLGCEVDVYAPFADEAERLRRGIERRDGLQVTGAIQAQVRPRRVSADAADVIPGSQVVALVLPAFAHATILREVIPYLDEAAWVGAIPARGGFDWFAARLLAQYGRQDVVLYGLQTLPWACRIQEYGRQVHVLGVKNAVDAASRPSAKIGTVAPVLARMLGLEVDPAANLLALTLANTGQLIHPGIMYGLFADWDGAPFPADRVPLFYHGLGEKGAEVLAALSDEIQAICARLATPLDLSAVRTLKAWLLHSYDQAIDDPSTLRSAFLTNRAYTGLKAPVREVAPGQFAPDFGARYLAEDVPYGLAVSRAVAELVGVQTPVIDEVITWAGARLGKDYLDRDRRETRIPQLSGLASLETLVTFESED